jgi:hypothetical protein
MAQKWGERLVALQEQIRELERAAGLQADVGESPDWGAIDGSLDEYAAETVEPNIDDAASETDDASDDTDAVAAVDEMDAETTVDDEMAEGDDSGVDSFENAAPPAVFEEESDEDESQFADIPGFEKEQKVFNERMASTHTEPDTDGLEVEPESSDVYSEAGAPGRPEEAEKDASSDPEDGFLTGPRGAAKARKAPEPEVAPEPEPAPKRRPPIEVAPVEIDTEPEEDGRIDIDADVEEDVDADALDLYALGAVDFVEGVHA